MLTVDGPRRLTHAPGCPQCVNSDDEDAAEHALHTLEAIARHVPTVASALEATGAVTRPGAIELLRAAAAEGPRAPEGTGAAAAGTSGSGSGSGSASSPALLL